MDVKMPDGTIVTNVPDTATKEQVFAQYNAMKSKQSDGNVLNTNQYTPEGIPLTTPSYGEEISGKPKMAAQLMSGIVSAPISASLGAGKAPLAIAQIADKMLNPQNPEINLSDLVLGNKAKRPLSNVEQAIEAGKQIQGGINEQAGGLSYATTRPAELAGEIGGMPLSIANKVIPQVIKQGSNLLPTLLRASGKSALVGGATGVLTPEETGLSPAEFAGEKALGTGVNAAIGAAIPGGVQLAKYVSKGIPYVLGGTTGAGSQAFKEAYKAGQQGNTKLLENMRGEVSAEEVLNDAKTALANMRATRQDVYRQGIETTKKGQIFYKFEPIENKLNEELKTLKVSNLGKEMPLVGEAELNKVNELKTEVEKWKKTPELWTASGLDGLKRRLDAIYPENLPQAQRIISAVRNKVYDHIVSLDPNYAKTMKAYEEAIKIEQQIEKSLSLGKKTANDTAIRKLLSLSRNNANTNFGYRQELANTLQTQGGKNLEPALAGQALNSIAPKGLVARGSLSGLGITSAGTLNPALLGLAPLSSPRLMGEATYKAGQLSNAITPQQRNLARLLMLNQANKMNQGE
jgi:hypothetical protein